MHVPRVNGEVVRGRRKTLKLSQEDLAERVHCSRFKITRIERGRHVHVTHADAAYLALTLGLSIDAITEWVEEASATPVAPAGAA